MKLPYIKTNRPFKVLTLRMQINFLYINLFILIKKKQPKAWMNEMQPSDPLLSLKSKWFKKKSFVIHLSYGLKTVILIAISSEIFNFINLLFKMFWQSISLIKLQ